MSTNQRSHVESPEPRSRERFTAALKVLFQRPSLYELVGLVYVIVGVTALEHLPVTYPRAAIVLAYGKFFLALVGLGALIIAVRHVWGRHGHEPGLRFELEFASLLRIGLGFLPVLAVHFLIKSFIHLFNARVWDRQLALWDVRVHLGLNPGVFLGTLFGNPVALHFVDFVYTALYYLVLVVYTALLLNLLPEARRRAFAAAFTFIWIAGSVVYVALPSWGPVFVVPEDYSAALAHMPLTCAVQSVLYEEISSLVRNPNGARRIIYGCVAAFPSLHVAMVYLLTVASRVVSRRWFRVNVLLLLVMLVGSVVTGYHYLVDGYAGVLLAAALWWLACRIYPQRDCDAPPLPPA
jgi:hypothetical protein